MNEPLFDISKTALVVIDLQKGIAAIPTAPHTSVDVILNAARLAKAFRIKNMPVFLVRVTPSADGKDALQPIVDGENRMNFARAADWAEIVPEMAAAPSDFIITKHQWGAFYGTELDLQLRRRKIETIVLCGIATNIGVESTARDAFERGYQQVFVEDACASMSAEAHQNTITTTFPRIGRIRSTDDVLAAMGG